MPRRRRLTDAGIARLRPEPREYTVWDTRVRGLGVRVRPSGARTYIHHRPSVAGMMGAKGVKGAKRVKGVRKVSLGPATARGIEEVRRACLAASAAAVEAAPAVRNATPQLWEFVAGAWKSACFDRYTPSTQRSMRSALNSRLLPAFGTVRLDRIRRAPVVRWFDAYSRTAPGGANRALDVLRQILDHAVACGHIPTNPARTIRRNRRTKLTRFLSREEIRRLHRVLDDHAERSVSARQQVDIIRLLLLTGCRKNEIVRLRWQEVDGDRLNLRKAKTGPRRVFLNAQARAIVERRREDAVGAVSLGSLTSPASPASPSDPRSPRSPGSPGSPASPSNPSNPSSPSSSRSSRRPASPTNPTNPSSPASPNGPASPASLASPSSLASPASPNGPTSPTSPNGSASPWVFPSVRNPNRPRGDELALWYCIRREAGLEEVRLHDLRHSVASHAVMLGVPLPVVARLLGHRQPSMTLRYAHVGDREIEAAAERVGQTISRLMSGGRLGGRSGEGHGDRHGDWYGDRHQDRHGDPYGDSPGDRYGGQHGDRPVVTDGRLGTTNDARLW